MRGWPPDLWAGKNLGIAGQLSRQIADRMPNEPCIVMAGTNDVSASDRPDFHAMLEIAQRDVIVCTIPPIANDDAVGGALAVRARGLWWNDQIRQLPRVVDLYAVLTVPGAIQADNVHLTRMGYELATRALKGG